MQRITVIQTKDGKRFDSQAEALHYLSANHSNVISKLSHRFHQKRFTDVATLLAEDEDTRALIQFAFALQDEIKNGLQDEDEDN